MSLTVCYKLSMQLSRPRPRARPRPEPSSTRPKLRPCRSAKAKAKAIKWLACMEAPRNQGLVSRTTSLMSWSEFIRLCHFDSSDVRGSYRVDLESALGVVRGVVNAQSNPLAVVYFRLCASIAFAVYRTASTEIQDAGHWRDIEHVQSAVHVDIACNEYNFLTQILHTWTLRITRITRNNMPRWHVESRAPTIWIRPRRQPRRVWPSDGHLEESTGRCNSIR